MVGDHIYLNIGGIFSLKPFNLTGIAGGFLFISHSFDEQLLKQYNKKTPYQTIRGFIHYVFNLIRDYYLTSSGVSTSGVSPAFV